ncbi:MAG: hypothetical protein WA581_06390 [Candidatus Acidiferrales bacterium]
MRLLLRFGIAALVGFLASSLIAWASYRLDPTLAINSDNVRLLIRFSVPFALLLGVAAAALPKQFVGQRGSPLAAVAVGALLAFSYTYIVTRFYMLGVIPFVVLMLSCWISSAISAMLITIMGRRFGAGVGVAALCLSAIFLTGPTYNAVTHNQQLTVAFITPSGPSTAQLAAQPDTLGFDTTAEIQAVTNELFEHIHALGLNGEFRVLSLSRRGRGKNSLAIVVIHGPVKEKAFLPEPDASTIAYVQESKDWTKIPSQVPTLRRGIEILPPPTDASDALATFLIPDASGVSLGLEIYEKGLHRLRWTSAQLVGGDE